MAKKNFGAALCEPAPSLVSEPVASLDSTESAPAGEIAHSPAPLPPQATPGRPVRAGLMVHLWERNAIRSRADDPDVVDGLRRFPALLIRQSLTSARWHLLVFKERGPVPRTDRAFADKPTLGCWTWPE